MGSRWDFVVVGERRLSASSLPQASPLHDSPQSKFLSFLHRSRALLFLHLPRVSLSWQECRPGENAGLLLGWLRRPRAGKSDGRSELSLVDR